MKQAPLNMSFCTAPCSVSYTCLYGMFLPGTGSRGQTQLPVSGTRRQQLSILQPFWQLPPLLLFSHGGDGWTQDQHTEEETVHLLPSSTLHSRTAKDDFVFSPYLISLTSFVFPVLQLCSPGVCRDGERLCQRPWPGGGGELMLHQLPH